MSIFQPSPLQRTDGTAVNGLLGTAQPLPGALPAINQTPTAPRSVGSLQLNVFGGSPASQSWGGGLFSQESAWSSTGATQPAVQPAAPAATAPTTPPAASNGASAPARGGAFSASSLPSDWAAYTPEQKISYFNRNRVGEQTLLTAGVPQADIDYMKSKGYVSSLPDEWDSYDEAQKIDYFERTGIQESTLRDFGVSQQEIDYIKNVSANKLKTMLTDRSLTSQQLATMLEGKPQYSAMAAKLPELEQKWLSGPIKLNDKNAGTNVLAAENLYQQIGGVREAVKQNNGSKEFWSGEGHGSLEKNQMAFTRALMEKGVTDLRQLSVREEPVMETGTFRPDGKGGWLQEVRVPATFGEVGDFETRMQPVRDAALVEKLNAAKPAEGETPKWMQIGKNRAEPASSTVSMEYDTGKKAYTLINKDNGQAINAQQIGDGAKFQIGGTTRGHGVVDWRIQMVKQVDSNTGETSYIPIPLQEWRDSSDMGVISGLLTVASFIPGVAPFAMGINAALAASTGNWTGAILSAAGAYGSYLSNANAALNAAGPPTAANAATIANNASTISNIKTGVGLVNTVNALNKGDALGAIGAGAGTAANAGLAGDSSGVLRNVAQGVGAIRTAQKLQSGLNGGNPLQIAGAVSGLFATARAY